MKQLAMLLILAGISVGIQAAGKPIEVKFGHYGAETHPSNEAANMFAENVFKRTNGQIKISVFPNNALGSPPDVLEQTIMGVVGMMLPSQPGLAKYVPKFDLITTPFAFKDYASADRFIDGPFNKWAAPDLEKKGLILLSSWELGFRQFTNSKKPINTPADVKGMKIRTPPDFVNQATVAALGGLAQTIAFPELLMALKTGTVDGQENPIGLIYANKLYETQKYLTIVNYTYSSMNHVINKKLFDSLSREEQQIIREESKKAGDFMRKKCRELETQQIEDMKKSGVVVNTPDPAPFKAAMGPAYIQIKNKVGEADYTTFMDMLSINK